MMTPDDIEAAIMSRYPFTSQEVSCATHKAMMDHLRSIMRDKLNNRTMAYETKEGQVKKPMQPAKPSESGWFNEAIAKEAAENKTTNDEQTATPHTGKQES